MFARLCLVLFYIGGRAIEEPARADCGREFLVVEIGRQTQPAPANGDARLLLIDVHSMQLLQAQLLLWIPCVTGKPVPRA
jgi:hypothetical protein